MPKLNVNSRIHKFSLIGKVEEHDLKLDQPVLRNSSVNFNSLTTDSDLTIGGNLTVLGSSSIISSETLELKDNIIEINSGETGDGISGNLGGIEINRGTLTNQQLIYEETSESWKLGLVGDLQAIATRENEPLINGIMVWNNQERRLDSVDTLAINVEFQGGANPTSLSSPSSVKISAGGGLSVEMDQFLGGKLYLQGSSGVYSSIESVLETNNLEVSSASAINLVPTTLVNIPAQIPLEFGNSSSIVTNSSGDFEFSSNLDFLINSQQLFATNSASFLITASSTSSVKTTVGNLIVEATSGDVILQADAGVVSTVAPVVATTASTKIEHNSDTVLLGNATTSQTTARGDMSVLGGLNIQGQLLLSSGIFDTDSTEALLVRKNNDGGDVFSVDTVNSRVVFSDLNFYTSLTTTESNPRITLDTGGDYLEFDRLNDEYSVFILDGKVQTVNSSGVLNVSGSYSISGVQVLSPTTLGSGVVNSSLTSVGTLTSLAVSGAADFGGQLNINSSLTQSLKVGSVFSVDTVNSRVVFSDLNFYTSLTESNPRITLDTGGDYLEFSRSTNTFRKSIGNNIVQTVNGSGVLNVSGSYSIAGVQVLSPTTLGSGVVNSSLTSVGTLTSLAVSGTADFGGQLNVNSVLQEAIKVGSVFSVNTTVDNPQVFISNLTLTSSSIPKITFDTNDHFAYNKTGNYFELYIAGAEQMRLSSSTLNTANSYSIAGVQVLSPTTLGSEVVNSSLTSVGVLNAGSITSGFGDIDNGTSDVKTRGLLSIPVDGTAVNTAGSFTIGSDSLSGIYKTTSELNIVSSSNLQFTTPSSSSFLFNTDFEINSTGIDVKNSGGVLKISGVETLSSTTLGSAVVNSSLTNLGTLTSLTVAGASSLSGKLSVKADSTIALRVGNLADAQVFSVDTLSSYSATVSNPSNDSGQTTEMNFQFNTSISSRIQSIVETSTDRELSFSTLHAGSMKEFMTFLNFNASEHGVCLNSVPFCFNRQGSAKMYSNLSNDVVVNQGGNLVFDSTSGGSSIIVPTGVDLAFGGQLELNGEGGRISNSTPGSQTITSANGTDLSLAAADRIILNSNRLSVNSTGSVSINAASNSNFTTTSGDLDLVSSAGSITLNSATEMSLDCSAGVSIDAAGSSNFNTTSGSLTFGGIGMNFNSGTGKMDLTSSGLIDVNAGTNMTIDTSSGSIKIATGVSGIPVEIGTTTSSTSVQGNLVVGGDLTVSGTSTTVNTDNLNVKDNAITINSSPGSSTDSGMFVKRYQTHSDTGGGGDVVADNSMETGTSQVSSSLTSIILSSADANSTEGYYTGWWIKITSGLASGNVRKIKSYDGTTKVAQIFTSQNEIDDPQQPPTGKDFTSEPTEASYELHDCSYTGFVYKEDLDSWVFGCSATPPGSITNFTKKTTLTIKELATDGLKVKASGSSGASVELRPSAGDLVETVYTNTTNSVSTPESITGLVFNSANTRSFNSTITVETVADTNIYSQYTVKGINTSTGWVINSEYIGDDTGVEFSIDSANGQISFTTTTSITGLVERRFIFRALANGAY